MNQLEREILLEMMLIEFENINKYLKKLKECPSNRNRADCGLEEKNNSLFHKFDIKRKVFCWKIESS